MALMTVSGLRKRYFMKQALSGVDMSLEAGRIYGLLGPNGSGKTTLLKILAGVLQPDEGIIAYPDGLRRGPDAKRVVSFLPDLMSFPSYMRVGEAFNFWRDMYPDYSGEKAGTMIELLELRLDTPLKRLSLGMKERVSLALVFSRRAKLYLLDEPLGGIDPLGKAKILDSIIAAQLEDACMEGDCERIREESGKTCEQVYLEVCSNAKLN